MQKIKKISACVILCIFLCMITVIPIYAYSTSTDDSGIIWYKRYFFSDRFCFGVADPAISDSDSSINFISPERAAAIIISRIADISGFDDNDFDYFWNNISGASKEELMDNILYNICRAAKSNNTANINFLQSICDDINNILATMLSNGYI